MIVVYIGICVTASADYKFNYIYIKKGINIVMEVVHSSRFVCSAYIMTLTLI